MTRANFLILYNAFHKRRRFRPYTIELSSGARLEVGHPEGLTLQEDLVLWQSSRGFRSVFEYASVVRFLDMTGMT